MRSSLGWVGLLFLSGVCLAAAPATQTAFDLVGNWESTVELGKFTARLIVKITRTADGRVSGKIDIPDQGAKDVPISAMLSNYPAVRWEVDSFGNTSFTGVVNSEANQITGTFDEGPGGRPLNAVFRRLASSSSEEAKRVYSFSPGEIHDIRGFWGSQGGESREGPGRAGLRIGRMADGRFEVLLDLLERGASDVAASTVQFTNATFRFEWQLFRISFEGKIEADGNRLSGTWKQNGNPVSAQFDRLERPATVLPENLSFQSEGPNDIRGYWKGILEVPERKLRIVFKLGKTPEGGFAGTLISPDQGPAEIPMSSGTVSNATVVLEWKSIHGVFKGLLNKEGTVLDGNWEQMGPPLKLKMERSSGVDDPAASQK